ncbi:MAG: hypothetical protein AB7E70_02910 [Hyphomicrobiaceae bacterium]
MIGAAIALAVSTTPAAAQDGWPWSMFEQPKATPKRGPRKTKRQPDRTRKRQVPASAAKDSGPRSKLDSKHAAWPILRTEWTARDEAGYEEFIRRIGESGCRTVHKCLSSPVSNPIYAVSNPPGSVFFADCADLPYVLRAYYAWKNGLPFSYSVAVSPLGPSRDIRYTARGNRVVSRRDIVGGAADARRVLREIADAISSAHYRYPPHPEGRLLPDHYPVGITPASIRPGTIIYDPNGHLAVVYKVTPEGRIHFIDSHPDNSLTRSVYGKAFTRASPAMGAGFKRWRPLKLVGAVKVADGTLKGGRVALAADKDIPDWSDEQFYGTEKNPRKAWRSARFMISGQALGFHEFVRKRLAKAGFKYDPLDEARTMMRTLCSDLKYRVDAVDLAIQAKIHLRPQPERLPNNIYGTEGDWEIYSTPSRDARLKTAFKELRDEVARFLALSTKDSRSLTYSGSDLRADLRQVYETEAKACTITYTRSDGSKKELSFADVHRHLFDLSFDPHHCVERRWGARDPTELATCKDGPLKSQWYAAEQRLRNQPDRTYDARMGFSLNELQKKAAGSGIDAPPDIDVMKLLQDPKS